MAAQRVSLRQVWMIEVVGRIVCHTELFHDPSRPPVAGNGKRNQIFKSQNSKRVPRYSPRTFSCQPLAPIFGRKAPSNFDAWGENCPEARNSQPDITNEGVFLPQFRRTQPETALSEVRLNIIDQRVAFLA